VTEIPDVKVLIIPEHFGDGPFFFSGLIALEMKLLDRRGDLPGRFVEFSVDHDRRRRPVNFITRKGLCGLQAG
jgi:hypothetical protein